MKAIDIGRTDITEELLSERITILELEKKKLHKQLTVVKSRIATLIGLARTHREERADE